MKRKYYKYTNKYCLHLSHVTCLPIRHKFVLPFMANRFHLTSNVSTNGYVLCDGSMIKLSHN